MKRNSRNPRKIQSSTSPTSPTSLASSASSTGLGRCQFYSTDNRRCRMPRWHAHPAYCLHHARREQQLLETERVAGELVTLTGTFKTAHDVNMVLGRLFTALAQKSIPPGNAATLAYIGGLLLQSLPRVSREVDVAYGYNQWDRKLRELFDDGAAALASQPETREPQVTEVNPVE